MQLTRRGVLPEMELQALLSYSGEKRRLTKKKLTLVEVYSCCVIYKLKYMHLSEEVRVQGSIAKIIIMVGHGHGSFSKKSKHCDLKISYAELIRTV